ncbi:MAG: UDP-N-acetylmuramate--L-alanine ligase [Oscillospiraceae bacterium]|nr:UDP-N-acetylmuramate--L-alanine ligase [Oscillospiraceae bacterium]
MIDEKHLLKGKKRIHFVGIGGSGMYPIVQILVAAGYEITGSDVLPGDIVNYERALGIDVKIPHAAQNVHGAELVVYTAAIMKGNPEIEEAQRLNIPCVERSVMLGYVASLYKKPICIAGTHGKTSTTAMTTQIMVMANKDPAAVIGGKLPLINGYGKAGTGDNIIVESCEFSNTYHHLTPHTAVLLNVDADHLDFFKTMDNLKASFRKFCASSTDTIIVNADDANSMEVVAGLTQNIITYGTSEGCNYRAVNAKPDHSAFWGYDLEVNGTFVTHVVLGAPGKHNVYNSMAAYAAASREGCTPQECAAGIAAFQGAGRRFEILGVKNGITIADDYAHHPTELEATLNAAMQMGFKQVWAVFQPFTYSRTKMLLDDFARVLQIADKCVMTEIMGSRETNDEYNIYTKDLAVKIPHSVWYNTFEEVVDYVMANAQSGDLVITLGCGDIYKAAKMMMAK